MKKYIYCLFAAAMLLLCAACSKEDQSGGVVDSGVVGEWHLTKWSDEAQADFDVYIEFMSHGKFNIYQQVETSAYVRYSGDFRTEGNHLSGRYSDGVPWSTDYAFELSGDKKTLTMTSDTDIPEVSIYSRTSIPEQVRSVREVRSALPDGFRRIL